MKRSISRSRSPRRGESSITFVATSLENSLLVTRSSGLRRVMACTVPLTGTTDVPPPGSFSVRDHFLLVIRSDHTTGSRNIKL